MTTWTPLAVPRDGASLSGIGAFRLMPNDAMAEAAASGAVRLEAQGWALALTCRWTHPTDGEADGVHLVMQNVVPEEALAMAPEGETFSAGPNDAMDLRLTRA